MNLKIIERITNWKKTRICVLNINEREVAMNIIEAWKNDYKFNNIAFKNPEFHNIEAFSSQPSCSNVNINNVAFENQEFHGIKTFSFLPSRTFSIHKFLR